jgi:O-antigen biosynthesis protein
VDVSVIIVNYNVEHFLSQCLESVRRGIARLVSEGKTGEIVVVDNHSLDGSCAMVRTQFPEVKLLALNENLGFAKANNLAMKEAQGRWVLLLNPDTVIQESTLLQCLTYADSHPELGGMGVPMVDGNGRYLPESKRGIPTPSAAFWKISGLYRLAPRSRKLNRYYLGHLPENETHPIEILSGAFMWMRKEALDQVGLLDERYFMYGEDIDLSWRILKGGWQNHYFAATSIIHYKGESTKKGSLNYVLVFYRAMQIFAKAHFSGPGARAMHALIQLAIYARASLAIAARVWHAVQLPLLEWALIWAALTGLLQGYGAWQSIAYQWELTTPAMALYALIWMVSVKIQGGYDRPWRWGALAKGVLTGSVVLLATYGLLPDEIRFSRAILLIGTVAVPLIFMLTRGVFPAMRGRHADHRPSRLYVAGAVELERIRELLRSQDVLEPIELGPVYALNPKDGDLQDAHGYRWLGGVSDLHEAIRVHGFNEVVMSGRDVSATQMIQAMSAMTNRAIRFRIAWTDGGQIVGAGGPESGSVTEHQHAIFTPRARRQKRLTDITISTAVLMAAPVLMFRGQGAWLISALEVLMIQKTWVGYAVPSESPEAPQMRVYVFQRVEHVRDRVNQRKLLTYIRDYRWTIDVQVIWEALISQRAIHRHGHN